MNRTLDQTAALFGIKSRAFRKALRELRILTSSGDLASHHRSSGHLFSDPRSVQLGPNRLKHYAVVMVTENGVQWLAKKLGIAITDKEVAA
jgi:hypothetical protein